ncbi:LOG family protein [Sphingomicrobium aestuariivivum]|uniref:LOG family protein n=1 Tax=Sphingomicrobium aestuariivivum TaxID=1582356 RepID=UPI001FD6D8E0|nr:TIGR00730 family Rossman fold protein [Sphingomicrobium aestuariivivum]MCJ8191919.1 TIGR00730 family Rossman fold protein [Sphingomicrobium aestuariivivum]
MSKSDIGRIAIYCGHQAGANPVYADMAVKLASEMANRGIDLVYGGGKLGLMGIVADTVLEAGGKVYGVIPQSLVDVEVAHPGLTELHPVPGMHERKAKMTELTDAFVCLPGGIGTMDELMEAWTWNALGYHAKPFCLLNVNGFWDGFASFCDRVADEGFMSADRRQQLLMAHDPVEAIEKLDEASKARQQGMVW